MARLACTIRQLMQGAGMLCTLLLDATRFLRLCLRRPTALAAENLFLRKQLALYQEHNVKPRRASDATRFSLVWLSQWFDWQPALAVVQPETFKRWRRQGFRLFWHCTPYPGRPSIPGALQTLIRQMARDNCTWGQRRIANELLLKLGLRSRHAPYASTCPRILITLQAAVRRRSAGEPLCASTPGRCLSVAWPRTSSSEASRPCAPASCAPFSSGGTHPSRAGGRGPRRVTPWSWLCCAIPGRHVPRGLQTPGRVSAWGSGARRTLGCHIP
jgi:hypothetical protein